MHAGAGRLVDAREAVGGHQAPGVRSARRSAARFSPGFIFGVGPPQADPGNFGGLGYVGAFIQRDTTN
jgi:hypothetical protein